MTEKMERRAKALEISAVLLSGPIPPESPGIGAVPRKTKADEAAKKKTDALFMIADLVEDDLARHA